ncbi:MAG TPA: FtsX-like permease family protein [Solirubrobacteraceae bacterium]|nr:FtsX-like permease family protein [Solirubrobacteraceae bacterium]
MNPKILGVRVSMLFHFYGWRLRRHTAQELLAGSGIAVGVALVFGVLAANTSVFGSASELVHGLTGSAQYQLVARSAHGFDERLAQQAGRLPGVQYATPLLRENAIIVGPYGRRPIQLIGITPSIVTLGGAATRNLDVGSLLLAGGLGVPVDIARAVGVRSRQPVTVLVNGDAARSRVRVVLDKSTVGSVADSSAVVSLLPFAQALMHERGRVTQVLIKARPGAERQVAAELRRFAAGRIDVKPADNELRLLAEASKPNDQSTTLFAAISVMVGFLLALNAMLLTVPERRRTVAELRTQGFDWRQVLLVLGFEALVLGLISSIAGILLGDALSRTFFHHVPAYLTFAFPVGAQHVVHTRTILLALGCGVLATLIASLPPVFDLRPSRRADAILREAGGDSEGFGTDTTLWLGGAGVAIMLVVTGLVLIVPSLTIVGGVLLALATLCLIPAVFAVTARALARFSEHIHGSMLVVAVNELNATSTRSIALAGVAALAIYGSVAVGGAQHDLLRGLDRTTTEYLNTADVWVTTDDNIFIADRFASEGTAAAIARAPGVSAVRVYQGDMLDVGARRLWVRARPADDPQMLQPSQLLRGDLGRATARLRQGGWMAISAGFAAEHDLDVGGTFALPTPSGRVRLGVAAITTNVGWPPGAVTLNTSDYSRYWQTRDPTALEVSLQPGVSALAGRATVARALAGRPGLQAQTAAQRIDLYEADTRQGLKSLGEISTLLLIAAALAIASALSATIWQRRARLASLKIQGFDRQQLWRALLLESAVVLGIGCAVGAVLGVYGHALASRALKLTTGFPAEFSLGELQVFITLTLVACIALIVVAFPGFLASRVSPRASFQE